MKARTIIYSVIGISLSANGFGGNGSSVHSPAPTAVINAAEFASIKEAVSYKRQIEIQGQVLTPKAMRGANSRYMIEGTTKAGTPQEVIIRVK